MRFVGWDWASTSHDVTVLDDQGRVVERWALRQTEQALAETLARLARHGEPAEVPVIIERSAGRTDATGCAGFNPWIQGWGTAGPGLAA